MAAVEEKPLSSFLIALSESPDLLERYHDEKQQAGLLAEHGLAGHPVFSGEPSGGPSLEELQAHVNAEQPNAETPSRWIKVPKLPPWIQRAPTESPEPTEPPEPSEPSEPTEPAKDPEENT